MSEIWAILEHREGSLQEQSGELLAELLEIAQRQPEPTTLCAVLLTEPDILPPDTPPNITSEIALLTSLDVQQLYLLEHPFLAYYTTGIYVNTLMWLLHQHAPLLVAASATANGRDWMPRLAARLRLPFVPGCLDLDLHDDGLFALRSIYEGRAYAHTRTTLHGRTALATLVPGVRGTPANTQASTNADTSLTITRLTPELPPHAEQERIHHLGIDAPSPEAIELEAAERIVAGGRGIGREGFSHIAAFARLLGAAVGATRVATDHGWVEHARQIGATGKSVHPRLYIACGISGAAQHTSGMRESQTIIAINPDRTAPILSLADLGLLGDANQILPLAATLLEKDR